MTAPTHVDWITCGRCHHRWTGLATCHCSSCHRTFTSISAFDIHRTGGHCNDPAEQGRLVPVTRRYWKGWGLPGERPPRD